MVIKKKIKAAARILVVGSLLCGSIQSASIKSVKLWINAFIPRTLPGTTNATPTFLIPIGPYKDNTAIAGPFGLTGYFLTDQRSFDSNPNAASRIHQEIIIDLVNNTVSSPTRLCSPTIKIDSLTTGVEVCNQAASASRIQIKDIVVSSDKLSFSFRLNGEANNPCVASSPDIDWDIKVTSQVELGKEGGTFKVSGLVEPFPAFEMYASVDGGQPLTIFNVLPEEGKDPWNLIGGPTVRLEKQPGSFLVKEFGSVRNGIWQSNDVARRFNFKINGNELNWTEINSVGGSLSRTAPITVEGQSWKIERPNDADVLRHIGIQPNLISDVLALGPKPSYILFTMKDGKLNANWYGLYVIKNPDGSVKEIIQPGVRPPASFIFLRQ